MGRSGEDARRGDIICLADQYGRCRYRRITALLRTKGWDVNAKRVPRIRRRGGWKFHRNNPSADVCGSTAGPASVSNRVGPSTSGL